MIKRLSLGFSQPARDAERTRVKASIARGVSEEELAEQKASFVFGNAPLHSGITKDSARHAASRMRLSEK